VSAADLDRPLNVPVMLTVVVVSIGIVVTIKPALVSPTGTVTLAGTEANAVLALCSVTTAPPAGAAPLKVTVP